MEKRPVAYQLYSAREEAAKDLHGVLKTLKEIGYDGVEFAGFYGHSADEVKTMLNDTGLTAISGHVHMAQIEADMFGVIADHKKLGCNYLAIAYLDEQSRPGASGFAGRLQLIWRFAALCKEAEIQLLYHNHDFEFVNLSGLYGLDFLYNAVPANLLASELDVCWVRYAGVDPCAYLAKYAGRCPVVHLKDYVGIKGDRSPYALIGQEEKTPSEDLPFSFKPWGYGCQDTKAIVRTAIDAGAKWFVVEQDESKDLPVLDAARLSLETLRRNGVK